MKKYTDFLRHNSGVCLGFVLIPFIFIFAYGCQSMVFSTIDRSRRITRPELVAEVDLFLSAAEVKFADLDRQDLVKNTIFNSVFDLATGTPVSPSGVALMLGNILGLGAIIDNVRKRTHINTLKGGHINGKEKSKTPET